MRNAVIGCSELNSQSQRSRGLGGEAMPGDVGAIFLQIKNNRDMLGVYELVMTWRIVMVGMKFIVKSASKSLGTITETAMPVAGSYYHCVSAVFPPTERFMKYLQNFIRGQQIAHSSVCMKQLVRTIANGARSQPSSWLELQALKGSATLEVPVKIMTGETIIIQADSATSAKEICRNIGQKLEMKDLFGFSVYISIYDQ
ncbi:unnamed protein product, partial [Ranitomeya imitator]